MSIEHVREFGTGVGPQPRWAAKPERGHAFAGLLRWAWAPRAHRRRPQHIYLDEMPAYLLRDIGVPPDFR